MIPTIEDIIEGLINGTMTRDEAGGYIQAHLDMVRYEYEDGEEEHYHTAD